MKLFEVTLKKVTPQFKNPFNKIHISTDDRTEVDTRTWKIEANNEAHIVEILEEAYEQDIPNIRGFSLHSVIETE